jgi:serine/threonine protein kinase
MLYEMLTGQLPFDADNAVSVALMQVNSEAQPPRTINPKIPVGFEQITMKAMQKSTRERHQSAAEVLMDLEELKRNPNIKFDYQTFSADLGATRPIGKIQEKTRTIPVVKSTTSEIKEKPVMVPPATEVKKKISGLSNTNDEIPVQDVQQKTFNKKPVIAGVVVAVVLFIIILLFGKLFGNKDIEVDSFVGMNYELQIKDNQEYNEKYNFEVYSSAAFRSRTPEAVFFIFCSFQQIFRRRKNRCR